VLDDKHFYDILRRTIVLHQTYARPILALAMTGKYIASMLVNYSLSKNSMNNMKSGKSAKLKSTVEL
jgi:hypothetical protein